ncbi:MAG: DUF1697 domain-containing protein [Austwickia sp.]|jgi:uncharacterized protein (DUF1697 family)|nr:MAG: DUF1697 domain-containing protein [Austwickia sp.]
MSEHVTYAAFLRAVNLGRTRKLPMARVREVLPTELGLDPVKTHIASGNILFGVPPESAQANEGTDAAAARHAEAIARVLGEVAGFEVPTVVLTPPALAQVLAEEPYDPAVAKHVNVALVQGKVPAALRARVEAIADRAVDGEGITVGARAIYLHVPHSIHASKLAAAYGRAAPEATARNLATVRTMAELLAAL